MVITRVKDTYIAVCVAQFETTNGTSTLHWFPACGVRLAATWLT